MTVAPPNPNPTVAAVREVRGQLVSGMAVAPPKPNPTVAAVREVRGQLASGMAVAPPKPNPTVAALREVRGQLASGMAIAPPARGHALLPPSRCWPKVCTRSAEASALLKATVFHGDAGTLWTEIPVGTHSFSTAVNLIYGDINADNMITIDPQQSGSDRFLFDLAVGAKVQMPLPTGTDKSPHSLAPA
jgi:hypothetical protein